MRDLLIVDFEATCWKLDDPSAPREDEMTPGSGVVNEIIEIGAVLLDGETLNQKNSFQSFVHPRYYPILSDFCKGLTNITQKQVDDAPGLFSTLMVFVDTFDLERGIQPIFCSWGMYDKKQLQRDCSRCNVPYPFEEDNHVNLKQVVSKSLNKRHLGMSKALNHLNLELEGTHHRGLDDALNIAKIVRVMRERHGLNISIN
jgi:inhibitor of KinA sporulation pathway (predicted exonuclease)